MRLLSLAVLLVVLCCAAPVQAEPGYISTTQPTSGDYWVMVLYGEGPYVVTQGEEHSIEVGTNGVFYMPTGIGVLESIEDEGTESITYNHVFEAYQTNSSVDEILIGFGSVNNGVQTVTYGLITYSPWYFLFDTDTAYVDWESTN